jgi:hypothetical protein
VEKLGAARASSYFGPPEYPAAVRSASATISLPSDLIPVSQFLKLLSRAVSDDIFARLKE